MSGARLTGLSLLVGLMLWIAGSLWSWKTHLPPAEVPQKEEPKKKRPWRRP